MLDREDGNYLPAMQRDIREDFLYNLKILDCCQSWFIPIEFGVREIWYSGVVGTGSRLYWMVGFVIGIFTFPVPSWLIVFTAVWIRGSLLCGWRLDRTGCSPLFLFVLSVLNLQVQSQRALCQEMHYTRHVLCALLQLGISHIFFLFPLHNVSPSGGEARN